LKLFPKLALLVSMLLIGVTVCLSAAFYLAERRSIHEQADAERRAILQNLVHIAQESFLTSDDLLMIKYTGWLQKWNPALVSASVVGTQGEVIAHSEPSRIGKPARQDEDASRTEVLVLTEPVKIGAHWLATASVGFSERYYDELVRARLRDLQKRVGGITLLALLIGIAVSFGVALSWTRPIGRLSEAAAQIGRGRYDLELDALKNRRDELGFLSRAFRKMADELRQLEIMKEDFVSAVTHELRSPLGAIESYLNLIGVEMQEEIPASVWQTYLDRLRANTQRLTRFVNDLLDVAAIERGKITLEPQSLSVGILAQDVLALFGPKLQEKKITGQVRVGVQLPPVFADPEKIRQVIVNLVSNALKFTPEGGRIEISAETLPQKKALRLSVRDTGIGISDEDQQKIFYKFEQVKSARSSVKGPKGTGLGLSICRALVELHGGTIGVESRPGEGSVFFFTLPIHQEAAHEPVAHSLH